MYKQIGIQDELKNIYSLTIKLIARANLNYTISGVLNNQYSTISLLLHLAIEVLPDLMELTNLQIQNKTELVYNKSPITVSPPIFGPKRVMSDTAPESLLNNQVSNYTTYDNLKARADFLYAIAIVIKEDILAKVQRSPS
ncbi:hypothetical protein F8M41_020090 [Gigaspora margarita]|uniref:Uncharacterized protein n=1 Tax=Gigaspora margarita TaxID=4874 RepID=A0A8H4B219_GIGMA|nr:hypothetical protein F8M41_020090 [Gigaspora margarita]